MNSPATGKGMWGTRYRVRRIQRVCNSEGGMIWLEALIELKFINSIRSSSNLSIRAFRSYPLIEIRQAVLCRAIRGDSISVNSKPPLWVTCSAQL